MPAEHPRAILSDKIFRLHLRKDVDPEFLVLQMNGRAYREQVRAAISGAEGLANNLPVTALRAVTFRLPPLGEQVEIVRVINRETEVLAATVVRLEREIQLLREFRTRLVADVVTGQVDVRGIAAGLPGVDPAAAWSSGELDPESADLAVSEDELTESEAERRSLTTFVIVGAGPTGVEMAGQIAELTRQTLRRRPFCCRKATLVPCQTRPPVLPVFRRGAALRCPC